MGAIKKAFEKIGDSLEKVVDGAGDFMKSAAKLDLKGMANSLKQISDAAIDLTIQAYSLTPAALAANKLLDGELDKIVQKAQKLAKEMSDTMIDNFESGLSNIKNGLQQTVKGLATGDLGKIAEGISKITLGTLETASNFGPGGIAKNVANMAVDAALEVAAEKVAGKLGVDPAALGLAGLLLSGPGVPGSQRKGFDNGCGPGAGGNPLQRAIDELMGSIDPKLSAGVHGGKFDARHGAESMVQGMLDEALQGLVDAAVREGMSHLTPEHVEALGHLESISNDIDTLRDELPSREGSNKSGRDRNMRGPDDVNGDKRQHNGVDDRDRKTENVPGSKPTEPGRPVNDDGKQPAQQPNSQDFLRLVMLLLQMRMQASLQDAIDEAKDTVGDAVDRGVKGADLEKLVAGAIKKALEKAGADIGDGLKQAGELCGVLDRHLKGGKPPTEGDPMRERTVQTVFEIRILA